MPHPGTEQSGASGSWYAATAPAVEPRPALAGSERADVCVVGAGFTGVSAALHLAERGYSVVVLEAERVGWGASGRNGGQVGSGLRESMDDLERALGPSRAAEPLGARRGGEGDHRRAHRPPWHRVRLAAGQPARVHARAPHGVDGGRGGVLPPALRLPRVPDAVPRGDARGSRERALRRGKDGRGRRAPAPPQVHARDGRGGGRGRSPDLRGLAGRADPVGPSGRGLDRAGGRGGGGARHPRRQRPSRPPRAADRVPDHADRQPSARDRTPRKTACPLAREERCVRALDEVRRRLLPVHSRPPAPLRRWRDVLRPAATRPRRVRPPLHAPRLSPARGRGDRPRVERAARDHEESPAARGADRPQRLLRPRVLGPWGGAHPDRGQARRGGGGGDRRALRRARGARAPAVPRRHQVPPPAARPRDALVRPPRQALAEPRDWDRLSQIGPVGHRNAGLHVPRGAHKLSPHPPLAPPGPVIRPRRYSSSEDSPDSVRISGSISASNSGIRSRAVVHTMSRSIASYP